MPLLLISFFPRFLLLHFGFFCFWDVPFLFGSSSWSCLRVLCRSQGVNHQAVAHRTLGTGPENLEHRVLCSQQTPVKAPSRVCVILPLFCLRDESLSELLAAALDGVGRLCGFDHHLWTTKGWNLMKFFIRAAVTSWSAWQGERHCSHRIFFRFQWCLSFFE